MLNFMDWYNATEEPFDEGERPVLLTDKQVLSLLSQRNGKDAWGSDLLKRLRSAGVTIPSRTHNHGDGSEPEEEPWPRTEAEGETLSLASRILTLSGSNPDRDAPACPICGSLYVADVGYEIQGRDYTALANDAHAKTRTKDVLIAKDYYRIPLGKGDKAGSYKRNAYLCLKCGNEYGEYDSAWEVSHAKDTDAKGLGYKVNTATSRMAKAAHDAASVIGDGVASLGGVVGNRIGCSKLDDDEDAGS